MPFMCRTFGVVIAVALLPGCRASHVPSDLSSADPSEKIPAIKRTADQHDRTQVRKLVDDLESDDPAVRLYAIHGLKDLTGRTFGYRYYDDDEPRAAAVGRWRDWLAKGDGQ